MKSRPITARRSMKTLQVLFSLLTLISMLATTISAQAGTTLVATKTAVVIPGAGTDPDGDGKADPGDSLEYTVTINNVSGANQSNLSFDDTPDANTTYVGGSLAASAVAGNDTFPVTVLGNVSIDSAALNAPFSVTTNDYLGLNPIATISTYDAITAQGGQVVMTTSGANMGKFTYNPPPGFEGTDTFTYTLADNVGAPSAAANRTATVSITVSGMVWFINNSAAACTTLAGGCGRLSNPFSSLAAFNVLNNGTSNNPAANDSIFIYESATGYSGAVTLLSGQKLFGQDATAALAIITGLTPPTGSPAFPAMNSANGTVTNITSTVTLNTNTTVRGLRINSANNTGLTDPAGAISGVNVSDVSVVTTTGAAVLLSSMSGTISLTSVSSNGATNGIALTSTTGSFTVNGDGANIASGGNNSGGTIQNTTGSDGASAGNGVYLNNAQNVTLRRMRITNSSNFAIWGNTVSGFKLEYSRIEGVNGTDAGTYNEGSIAFTQLTGAASIQGTLISGGLEDNFRVINTSGSLNPITFDTVTIGANDANNGNAGILLDASGSAVLNPIVQSSNFTASRADLFHLNVVGSASSNLSFQNNSLSNNQVIATGGGGVTIGAGDNNGTGANLVFNISNNTFRDANGHAILIFKSTDPGTVQGTLSNNTIGAAAVVNSGSAAGDGIKIQNAGLGAVTVKITNNNIYQYNNFGIDLVTGGGAAAMSGAFNATVTGNTISNPGSASGLSMNGIQLNGGTVSGDTFAICADIGGAGILANKINGSGANLGTDVRLRQRQSTTVRLPGYSGANNDNTAVQNYLTARNTTAPTALASNNVGAGGGGFINGGACAQPTAMLPGQAVAMAQTDDMNPYQSQPTISGMNLAGFIGGANLALPYSLASDLKAAFLDVNRNLARLSNWINHLGLSDKPNLLAPEQAPGIVHLDISTLPNNKSIVLKFRVTINALASLPVGTSLVSNQGTVTYGAGLTELTDDPAVTGANNPTVTNLDIPDLTVSTSNNVSGATVLGNNWTWGLHIANSSTVGTASFSAGQTILTDNLDSSGNLSYGTPAVANPTNITNSGNISCGITSNTLTCSATGPVIIGAAGAFDVTFSTTPSVIGAYTNPRSGGLCAVDPNNTVGEIYDSNNSCNSDSVTVTAPDLTISKANNATTPVAGQGWNWTLTVSNTGNAGASFSPGTMLVQDDLDNSGGVTYGTPTVTNVTNVTNSGSIQCAINGSRTLTCTANGSTVTVGAATSKFDVVVPVTSIQAGTYTNPRSGGICRADPSSISPESSETNNNCVANSVTVLPAADLQITKTAPATVDAGKNFDYTITITNQGPSGAQSVTLTDTLPANTTFVSQSQTSGLSFTLANTGNNINDSIGMLAAGETAVIKVTVLVNASVSNGSALSNTANISSVTTDLVSSNNTSMATSTVRGASDLVIAKTHTGNFRQGDLGDTYTLTVTNQGVQPTSGTVSVVDTLPASLTAADIAGANWSCSLATLTCTRSDALAMGAAYEPITLKVNVAANASASLTNTASVSGGGDANTSNNTASDVTTIIQAPDLTVNKSHNRDFTQGQTGAQYTISVMNSGGSDTAGAVTVVDTLPSGLTATALGGTNWTCNLAQLTCTNSSVVAAGSSYAPLTLTVNVSSSADPMITNQVDVSGGGEINTSNNRDTDTTVVNSTPDTTINTHPTDPSNSVAPSFTFAGSAGTAPFTFECQLDGAAFAACPSPQSYTSLSDGSHTFQVRAVDANGMKDSTPASYTWIINTSAPGAPLISTPEEGSTLYNPRPTISGGAGSADAGATLTVKEGDVLLCTATAASDGSWSCTPATNLTSGSHSLSVTQADLAGNVSPASTRSFTIGSQVFLVLIYK